VSEIKLLLYNIIRITKRTICDRVS